MDAAKIYNFIEESGIELAEEVEFSPEVIDWVEWQGYSTNPQFVGKLLSLDILLKITAYNLNENLGDLPYFDSLNDFLSEIESAYIETGDPGLQIITLDKVLSDVPLRNDFYTLAEKLPESENLSVLLGTLFEQIVSQRERRELGQFHTPIHIARLMSKLVIQNGDEKILDPGIGSGTLSMESIALSREISDNNTSLVGIEKNEISLLMAAVALSNQSGQTEYELLKGDFLTEDWKYEYDAVICNPPYTATKDLDNSYKSDLQKLYPEVPAKSPLYVYFYRRLIDFLEPGAQISLITPSEFLQTSYGVYLKQLLLENFDIQTLILIDEEESAFKDVMTTSCITQLQYRPDSNPSSPITFVRAKNGFSPEEIIKLSTADSESEAVNHIQQSEISPGTKWTDYFFPLEINGTENLTPLKELGTVKRGIATGANPFFCLSEKERLDHGIDKKYLSELIRRSSEAQYLEFTDTDFQRNLESNREVWLLDVGPDESLDDSLDQYIQKGEEEGFHKRHLTRNRSPWYRVEERAPAPILVNYMNRNGARFIKNKTDCKHLNNLHGLYTKKELSKKEEKSLLAYLNSEFANMVVKRSGRTYSTGLDKIEPNELEDVPVFNPRKADSDLVTELANLFENLSQASREGEARVKDVRKNIDLLLENKLGLTIS